MTYLIMLGVIVFSLGIGYIYISGNYQDFFQGFGKSNSGNGSKGGPVDDFLAEDNTPETDEPKVIFLGDIESEKAKRNKKKN